MTSSLEQTTTAARIYERSQEILDDQPWLSQDQAKDIARRELGVPS